MSSKYAWPLAFLLLASCIDEAQKQEPKTTRRFAAVGKTKSPVKVSALCELSFSETQKAPKYEPPISRELPAAAKPYQIETSQKNWRWVNIWASWCGPCVEEFPLLAQWQKALRKEKINVDFEFWSMDEDGEKLVQSLKKLGGLPGSVHWVRSPDDVPPFFDGLNIEPMSPIPVHVLVDTQGKTRCVRVGKIGEDLYGSLRQLLSES